LNALKNVDRVARNCTIDAESDIPIVPHRELVRVEPEEYVPK
jgi:hypothetical protein